MAGDDDSLIGKRQNLVVQRAHDLFIRPAGQVCAADAAGEQSVSGDQLFLSREVKANAALGMAGGMDDAGLERTCFDRIRLAEAAVDFHFARGRNTDPGGLNIQHLQ